MYTVDLPYNQDLKSISTLHAMIELNILPKHFEMAISSIKPQYGNIEQGAISLPFNLHCKAIATLFIILYCCPI